MFLDYAEDYADTPLSLIDKLSDYEFVGAVFRGIIADGYELLYERGWADGYTTLEQVAGTGIDLVYIGDKAKEWAEERAGILITNINESTRDMIRSTVEQSVSAEQPWSELKETLKDTYAFSDRRAETIARTESGVAYNTGAVSCWKESGIVSGVTVVDGEDDEPCATANGQIWTFEQAEADPLAHPNCVREFFPNIEFSSKGDYGKED